MYMSIGNHSEVNYQASWLSGKFSDSIAQSRVQVSRYLKGRTSKTLWRCVRDHRTEKMKNEIKEDKTQNKIFVFLTFWVWGLCILYALLESFLFKGL